MMMVMQMMMVTNADDDNDEGDEEDDGQEDYERWKLVDPSFMAVCSRSRILSRDE